MTTPTNTKELRAEIHAELRGKAKLITKNSTVPLGAASGVVFWAKNCLALLDEIEQLRGKTFVFADPKSNSGRQNVVESGAFCGCSSAF